MGVFIVWEIDEDKSEDHWLEVNDPEGWYCAVVKWDGCVNFRRLCNVPLPITNEHPQFVDCIHFCDLDKEIERLQKLRDKAKEFFGEDWPD
jgi:hypothetical protein